MTVDQRLEKIIAAFGIDNGADAIRAARETGLPLSTALALLENESGGRNVFGADPGGIALFRSWFDTPVTRVRYTIYKLRRNTGLTPNGVGPCQLTSTGLQKEAERRGGCWKPLHNMQVGFRFLHSLQNEFGEHNGFRAYNGSGPAAESYANRAIIRSRIWHGRIMAAII